MSNARSSLGNARHCQSVIDSDAFGDSELDLSSRRRIGREVGVGKSDDAVFDGDPIGGLEPRQRELIGCIRRLVGERLFVGVELVSCGRVELVVRRCSVGELSPIVHGFAFRLGLLRETVGGDGIGLLL